MTPIEVAQLKPFPIHFELNKHNIQYIDTMFLFITLNSYLYDGK